jgi:hypothetical protein
VTRDSAPHSAVQAATVAPCSKTHPVPESPARSGSDRETPTRGTAVVIAPLTQLLVVVLVLAVAVWPTRDVPLGRAGILVALGAVLAQPRRSSGAAEPGRSRGRDAVEPGPGPASAPQAHTPL